MWVICFPFSFSKFFFEQVLPTGKSSLFNLMIRQNKSLITETPGTTRDRIYGNFEWRGHNYIVCYQLFGILKTHRFSFEIVFFQVVDTGGMMNEEDFFSSNITEQAKIALDEADLILFMVDFKQGMDNSDQKICRILRNFKNHNKPVLLLVNKIDNKQRREEAESYPYERLGLGDPNFISVIHSEGLVDLMDKFIELVPQNKQGEEAPSKKSGFFQFFKIFSHIFQILKEISRFRKKMSKLNQRASKYQWLDLPMWVCLQSPLFFQF